MKNTPKILSRRHLLAALPFVAAAGATRAGAAEPDKKPKSDKKGGGKEKPVEYLFVQTADRVTYDGKTKTMTMHDVSPTTLFFSDRPERITGHGRTQEYVANWAKGEDSFEADAPNGALCIMGEDDKQIGEAVVVLKNPVLKDGNLGYQVEILDGKLPESSGAASLFIDVIGRPLTPASVAGVARRTTRRTVARRATYGRL